MIRENPTNFQRNAGFVGAGLVALTGLATMLAVVMLDLDARERDTCLYIGLVLLTMAAALTAVPWARLPQRALLASPTIVVLAVGLVGLLLNTQSQPMLALMFFSVVYLGLTQPPGATLMALPVLLADWWLAFPSHPLSLLARLPLVIGVILVTGELTAVTQRRWTSRVAALWTSSNTDPLTNIGNRRARARHLAAMPVDGSVIFIDLDNFKTFNDRYGHAAGDVVLMQFANVMTSVLRAEDIVARFGGEEFVLVINGAVEGREIYSRVRDAWHAAGAAVTFSAGFAQRRAGEAPAITLSRADAALYQAKVNGRDRLEVASPTGIEVPAVPRREILFDHEEFSVRDLLDQVVQRHPPRVATRENTRASAEPVD